MKFFLDESGDLGWSLDKPYLRGGSSRFITIAGIGVEDQKLKPLMRYAYETTLKCKADHSELKGSEISNHLAVAIVKDLIRLSKDMHFQFISITANKNNVNGQLRRDTTVFYNHLLNNLLSEILGQHDDLQIILDDRTTRKGSRNSFEDCLRAKCWGELGLNTNISCRFEESNSNPGIWIADWLANFIWRHYENNLHDAYVECSAHNSHYHEKILFM